MAAGRLQRPKRSKNTASLTEVRLACVRNPAASYSPRGSTQVPSALAGLTSVFGMGTGVSPPPWPPKPVVCGQTAERALQELHSEHERNVLQDPSPRPISTGQLNTLLCLHFRPINVVVFHGPYLVNPWEISS